MALHLVWRFTTILAALLLSPFLWLAQKVLSILSCLASLFTTVFCTVVTLTLILAALAHLTCLVLVSWPLDEGEYHRWLHRLDPVVLKFTSDVIHPYLHFWVGCAVVDIYLLASSTRWRAKHALHADGSQEKEATGSAAQEPSHQDEDALQPDKPAIPGVSPQGGSRSQMKQGQLRVGYRSTESVPSIPAIGRGPVRHTDSANLRPHNSCAHIESVRLNTQPASGSGGGEGEEGEMKGESSSSETSRSALEKGRENDPIDWYNLPFRPARSISAEYGISRLDVDAQSHYPCWNDRCCFSGERAFTASSNPHESLQSSRRKRGPIEVEQTMHVPAMLRHMDAQVQQEQITVIQVDELVRQADAFEDDLLSKWEISKRNDQEDQWVVPNQGIEL